MIIWDATTLLWVPLDIWAPLPPEWDNISSEWDSSIQNWD